MTPQQIVYKSKSWKDFEEKISKLQPKERGTIFEWLCVFYLQVEPRYKTTYKRVLHSSEYLKENDIKRKLGLQHNEQGTDIIGETYDGKIDIIQCKYKDDKQKNITAKDINDPIRIAKGREAKKWVDTILICSNLKGFTKNKTLDQLDLQFRTVSYGDFQSMTKEDFENIRRVIDKKIPKYQTKKPRKHQIKAVKAIEKHFKKEKRGQIIHACGTGKTLTAYYSYKKLRPRLTLFAVPSLQLINQTLIEWTKESLADGSMISPFVVCSDKSNEKIGECEPELWLQELGIKVSNKQEELDIFLKSKRKNKVIFSTYQSGKVLAKNIKALDRKIDFAFFDEAHNTATAKSKLATYLLSDKNVRIQKRLFMTATPKKFVGSNDEITSMDDERVFGKLIDEITVKDAIEGVGGLKLLNDYQIVTQIVDSEKYIKLLEDNPFVIDKVKLPEEVELKLLSSSLTLKKIRSEKKIKNVVSFHSRRNRANAFRKGAKQLDDELHTYYVDGRQSGTERQNILEEFAHNSPSLVTNAQCLSEGVNVPSIDGIMFVDPKQSKVDITQAIGRALRKGDKNKGRSYIIVPIVVDKDNPDNIDEAYQQILMVLRAMSEHDGRIVEYFKFVRQGKKPPKNFLEINNEYLPEEFDLEHFTKTLHFKAWDRVAQLGRRPWEQARKWARGLGINSSEWRDFSKTDAKPIDIPSDPAKAYKKEWVSWNDFLGTESEEEKMNKFIKNYLEYSRGKIFPMPPESHPTLGIISKTLRSSFYLNQLPKWKFKLIDENLVKTKLYDWEGSDSMRWKISFDAYKEWKNKTKKDVPPKKTVSCGVKIETWYQNQKVRYAKYLGINKGKKVASLTEWQVAKLKSINFLIENKIDADWEHSFKKYKPLIIQHKGKIPESEKSLRRWISKQRSNYKDYKLEEGKIKKLESIKYWIWNPFEERLENNLQILELFYKETKNSNPKQHEVYQGFKIGIFLTKLRKQYRDKTLDKKIIKRIKKLGIKLKPSKVIGNARYYD